MASGPITAWQMGGEKVEMVTDFIFLGSKITVDSNWRYEIKRCSFLGRKPMTNLDNTLKSRNITLPTKVRIAKAMIFPVVMYGCESWTTKKAEHWRTDAFELWCWRRLLRVPWTAKRSKPILYFQHQEWLRSTHQKRINLKNTFCHSRKNLSLARIFSLSSTKL